MTWTQENRSLRVYTPLGDDKLLLLRFDGAEAISQLFEFQLELLAENATQVAFDKLIGQPIGVELDMPDDKTRFFAGICNRLSEGVRDAEFTQYRMGVVPPFWLLTRRTQCRIFQQRTVPEILKEVMAGLAVKWDLQGKYYPRDYCVQYRESDFAFASRLMEEEGIYYYFAHKADGVQIVVGDTPLAHVEVPEFPKVRFEAHSGGNREEMRVSSWEKVQELRSGRVTLWDHCFELPGQNLAAETTTIDSVSIGKVTHKLKLSNEKLELFDYPGAYAQRFDGIDPGGGDRAGDLQRIFEDNVRTAKIRMEQEAAQAVHLRGASNCRQFTPGHKFTLERHFSGDGAYILLEVRHEARQSIPVRGGGDGGTLEYGNHFTCLPATLPYRPPCRTNKSRVQGPQTATVVGPPGEGIHCDKYGRVKVKFHWDRHPGADDNSSCWVRVSQNWGGAKWGGMFIPHAGQEVIVEFEEGDPDRPLITGRVYNAAAMPPGELPGDKTKSIIRDHGGNEIIMEGVAGKEQIRMFSPYSESTFLIGAPHSPGKGFWFSTQAYMYMFVARDYETAVMGKQDWQVVGNETMTVFGNAFETVRKNKTTTVIQSDFSLVQQNRVSRVNGVRIESTRLNRSTFVSGNETEVVKKKRSATVKDDHIEIVEGNHTETVNKKHSMTVKQDAKLDITGKYEINTGQDIFVQGEQKIFLDAGDSNNFLAVNDVYVESEKTKVQIRCGDSKIVLEKDGTITIHGTKIDIKGTTEAKMHSSKGIVRVAGNDTELRGTKIDGEAGALYRIKGTPVKINCS